MPSLLDPIPPNPDVAIESVERVWNGYARLDLVRFSARRFDGSWSGPRQWEVLRRGRASAVLPYDPVADAVVLIEQFRLPALCAGLPPVLVEIPAGMCDGDEAPGATALREIQEEMHLPATRLEPVGTFLLTAGGSDETCAIFVGQVTAPAAGADGLVAGSGGLAAEHEDIRARVWPAAEAEAAALAGRIPNSVASLGLLWLAARRPALRAAWLGAA
jgi:ADP-ribose pyrophosphatase